MELGVGYHKYMIGVWQPYGSEWGGLETMTGCVLDDALPDLFW